MRVRVFGVARGQRPFRVRTQCYPLLASFLMIFIIFTSLFLGALFSSNMVAAASSDEQLWVPESAEISRIVQDVKTEYKEPIRGIYLPSRFIGDEERMSSYMDLARQTEINAFVIDVKDDDGWITYESQLEAPNSYEAIDARMGDLGDLVSRLNEEGIYSIARVVVFKDSKLVQARPDLAVLGAASNTPWIDSSGSYWVDPYERETWDYNIEIAQEVIEKGFDEVQFDYVRFPSDGDMHDVLYPFEDPHREKTQVIHDFLREAHWTILSAGGRSSADIFGMVTTVRNGMGIGQRWEDTVKYCDYISPMVYPSHYGPNIYGLSNPNAAPFETVDYAMRDALKRNRRGDAYLRPWLQDFSWGIHYGRAEVRAQIDATYANEINSWLLWNPAGNYTRDALKPSSE